MAEKTHKKSKKGLKGLKKEEKQEARLNFGLGELSLGGLFNGVEKLIDLAQKAEEAGGELRKEGVIKGLGGKKDLKGVYGFTIKTGLGQRKPFVETFGNVKETKWGPKIMKAREPIVDIFDEKDHILIVVELPGVNESDINLDFKGDVLILEAGLHSRTSSPKGEGGEGKYNKEILLPAKVDIRSKEVSFKNGILEIHLSKSKQ